MLQAERGQSSEPRHNCDHQAFFAPRFLKDRLGLYGNVIDASFVCGLCRSSNVKLSACAQELAEKKLTPGMAFGGIYQKYLL
jgi:hypothetical protein